MSQILVQNDILTYSSYGLFYLGLGTAAAADTIETVLFSLLNDSDITDLVSDRIYPTILDQKASMPAITYQQVTGVRVHTMNGAIGMCKSTFQVNCWASTYRETRQLSEVVRKTLDGYSGTVDSFQIYTVLLRNEGDMFDAVAENDKLDKYAKRLDFEIWFKEDLV